MKWNSYTLFFALFFCSTFAVAQVWNNPHVGNGEQNIYYSAIASSPKTLDPAKAYSSDEIDIISQIYEPVLQYHFHKRPYQLEPLTAISLPKITYYDQDGNVLPESGDYKKVAKTIYDIEIKKGIYYQPHPAFAKNKKGEYRYLQLSQAQTEKFNGIADFKKTGTKELTAADYIYAIKRLASPKVNSPIFGIMSKYIVGLKTLDKALSKANKVGFLDLRQFNLKGVELIDRYHYRITIKGKYPQFTYWLAMTFFSPIPWEVDAFYSQQGLQDHNITLSWYPVGTGPYMLIENNPNKQMVLLANPNYHSKKKGMIEKVIFVLDKESIPRWNKFLQGYYDKSGISADSFDQAIKIGKNGKPYLTESMRKKGIKLQTSIEPGVFYIGFNMLDPVVGGYTEKQRKLRLAIGIALDYEEYISIFLNGRGIPAQGPIPKGIFGYLKGKEGVNPYVYEWFQGKPKRRSIDEARQLLREAGYPGGINPKTGKPLILNYDVATSGNPDDKARFDWLREQFAKLGIKLNIRATLYNRFQDKVRTGKAQIFSWGWMADYPDPENFLFLLYGANAKVKKGGENAANYVNPTVDALFEQIRAMPNGPARQQKINDMLAIVRHDSPWIWGFHPISFTLSHQWNKQHKPNPMARNSLKYQRINPKLRAKLRYGWNQPAVWPFYVLGAFLLLIIIPLIIAYRRREHRPNVKKIKKE